MASSLTADSYNLSTTQHQNNCNKELIFVKLTDSALRAIEEFVKNQNKYGSSNPSIQFLGNEGFLSFPSICNNNGSTQQMEQKFSFQLADNEETQGSFECLQQSSGLMNVLGPVQYKMRVQAQEDVYENTRRSMAQAAQNQKNKCTREIKPNQQDIGRKITKKPSSIIPYSRTANSGSINSSNNSSNSSNSLKRPLDVTDRNSISSTNDNGNTNSMSHFTSQQQIPANNNNSHSNYNSQDHHHDPYHQSSHHHNNALNGVVGDDLIDHQRMSSNMGHLNRNNGQQSHRNPDIMRKPIKERLIHLLALRPFKKPELYDRLNREGIRDRDRSVITNVLKSISFVRDNAYVLHRHIWNDVHEDWPFYSEQDRATLKRRKPQNLTPPLSSDGGSSSTSGQSPNSQHNGSPPPPVKRPSQSASSMNNNGINNGINDKYSEPVVKKQRISHYKKNPHDPIDRLANSYDNSSRDGSSFISSRSRDNDDCYFGSNITPNSLDDNSLGLNFTVLSNEGMNKRVATSPISNGNGSSNSSSRGQSKSSSNNNNNNNVQDRSQRSSNQRTNGTIKTTTSNAYDMIRAAAVAASNNGDDLDIGLRESLTSNNSTPKNNFSNYPPIASIDQRRKYKTEFDKDYTEYRQLHTVMEKARSRFADLQDELRKVHPSERKYKEIQNQIIQEYKDNNNDSSFQDKKQRFDYLHEKLSHIKKLVSDYDAQLTMNGSNGSSSNNSTKGNNVRDNDNALSYNNSPQKSTNVNDNTQSAY